MLHPFDERLDPGVHPGQLLPGAADSGGHDADEDVLVAATVDGDEPAAAVALAAVLAAGLVAGAEVPLRYLSGAFRLVL